jgi:hypothetical protein
VTITTNVTGTACRSIVLTIIIIIIITVTVVRCCGGNVRFSNFVTTTEHWSPNGCVCRVCVCGNQHSPMGKEKATAKRNETTLMMRTSTITAGTPISM